MRRAVFSRGSRVRCRLQRRRPVEPPPALPDARLSQQGGAFVTPGMHRPGRDPGTLVETVHHVAAAAATQDPRFPPLRTDELGTLVIEISVLGPLEPCEGPHGIEIGRHGLVVEDGPRRGLLLPQVAVEWVWDSQIFASNTCLKAGLRPDAWKAAAKLFMFEADVFSEADEEPPGFPGP